MKIFYQIRKSLFNIDYNEKFNIMTVLCPDNFEKNIILANIIANSSDAVPEENVENYHDYDRTTGYLVSISSVLKNLLFFEV